jgi:hypothetical protein
MENVSVKLDLPSIIIYVFPVATLFQDVQPVIIRIHVAYVMILKISIKHQLKENVNVLIPFI